MKTLRQVAQVLGASDPVISMRSLANMLHILPPISLRHLITRGSYEMDQPIRDKWAELRWETGPLGWPTTETLSKDEDFVHYTEFQHGAIYWTGETGAHAILEPIWSSFNTFPYDHVVPITDTLKTADGRGLFSDCLRYWKDASNKYHVLPQRNVSWYWSQTTGLHWMEGLIASKWKELGGVQGSLGYPVSDTLPGRKVEWAYPDSGGAIHFSGGHYQIFEHGTISKYTDWWTRYSSKETFDKVYATQSGDPFPPEFYTHLDGTHGLPDGPGLMSFALGPTELVPKTLRIISAEWTVTPNWKPSLKATVQCTLANNTATAFWTLPESPPAGADHRVAVELSFHCEVGGVINDIPFTYQQFQGTVNAPSPVLVGVGQGKDLQVSWLATWSLDPNISMVVVAAGVTNIG